MATTIQVSEETKQMLDILKEREEAPSYEAVLRPIIDEKMLIPKSMFGKLPKRFRMTKKDKLGVSHF